MTPFLRFLFKKSGPRRKTMSLINEEMDREVMANASAQRRRIDAVNELLRDVVDGLEKDRKNEEVAERNRS